MPDLDRPSHDHPIGTLAIVGIYGLLFVIGWIAVYAYVFLARGRVTP
jgi:hypothetical protein